MKKILSILSVVFVFSNAQANDDLAASMEIIGEQFKIISTAIQAKELTENELTAVETMQKEIAKSALLYPDNATTDELKIKYMTWMAELQQMALNLEELAETAMTQEVQDLANVTAQFVDINELRKKGHTIFKE